MLRSMLKVRYGSGWSRLQAASAARPSARRSASRSSVTPSSNVSRSPSTTRCKIAATMEDKVDSFRGQAESRGHRGEPPQAGDLGFAQVVGQDAGQVIVTGGALQAEPRPGEGRQLVGMFEPLGPAPGERLG